MAQPPVGNTAQYLELPNTTHNANTLQYTSIENLCTKVQTNKNILIAFIPSTTLTNNPTALALLSTTFHIPLKSWKPPYDQASGYFHSSSSQGTTLTTSLRFLIKRRQQPTPQRKKEYYWQRLTFHSFTDTTTNAINVLCITADQQFCDNLCQNLNGEVVGIWAIHAVVVQQVVVEFDKAVWEWRDAVRGVEERRMGIMGIGVGEFEGMHEIARHVIHCSEMLSTGIMVVEGLKGVAEGVEGEVGGCLSVLRALSNRSGALEKRLQNEIALAFHINEQHNNMVTKQIAELSQQDGRVTRGISVLGMVFLPSTFVSALFSMSFFTSESLTVSKHFWVYWVITVPLTIMTLATWWWWQKREDGRAWRT